MKYPNLLACLCLMNILLKFFFYCIDVREKYTPKIRHKIVRMETYPWTDNFFWLYSGYKT